MIIPKIETERLMLRAPNAGDYNVYQAFYGDELASAAYGGPLSDMLSWKKLAADLGHWPLRGYGMWSLQERQSEKMIGGCGLVWPEGYPRSELTWWIIPTARRKGYALEASKAVIKFAYEELKWDMVETHMNDENTAARNLVVRRHIKWHLFRPGLRETLLTSLVDIKRRLCGIASVDIR